MKHLLCALFAGVLALSVLGCGKHTAAGDTGEETDGSAGDTGTHPDGGRDGGPKDGGGGGDAGNGDGGRDAGHTDGGGGSCAQDSDCTLGQLCIDKVCATGCRSTRDCPQGLACDTSRGTNGECVQCLTKEDCSGGLECVDGKCQFFCATDADCPGRRCDLATKQCVDCLGTDDCPLGNICDDKNKCVPGCASTRDCPQGLLCDTGSGAHGACVTCLKDGDCTIPGQGCRNGACITLCASDADCGGLICDTATGECVQCLKDADCALGNVCDAKTCVPGCASTRDCPQPLKCDPQVGPHGTCLECAADADCGAGSKCVQNRCVKTCAADADCTVGHCDTSSGKCVECTQDDHCALGTICINASCTPGCRGAQDCPQPKKCDTATTPGRCVDCLVDGDCGANGTCDAGVCKYPGKQCGEACTAGGNECAQGLACGFFTQTCVPVCTDNTQCPGSQCLNIGTGGVCMACPPPTCNPPCAADEDCVDGACVKKCFPPCDFGFACNNGVCDPVATDCTPACTPGQFCWSKTCSTLNKGTCPAGMIRLTSPSVCIDRFEASLKDGALGNADGTGVTATAASIGGAVPITSVTYYQASRICKNTGKRLCTAPEWTAACAGPGNHAYPYGDTYVAGTCNSETSDQSAKPTGSFIGCISQVGAVDMSGNTWEWTDTQYSAATDRKIMGGSFASTAQNSTCTSDLNFLDGQSSPVPLTEVRETLGFRCCLTK